MATEKVERTKVFISYSRKDTKWLERLQVHLKPLERIGVLELWDDTQIATGKKWREEIRNALASAKIAVLLISADFLASDFITEDELPPLLAAAGQDGAIILPVIISPSMFTNTPSLAQFQAVNPPDKPLIKLPKAQQEEYLVQITVAIGDALNLSFMTPVSASQATTAPLDKTAVDVGQTDEGAGVRSPQRPPSTPLKSEELLDELWIAKPPISKNEDGTVPLRRHKAFRRSLNNYVFSWLPGHSKPAELARLVDRHIHPTGNKSSESSLLDHIFNWEKQDCPIPTKILKGIFLTGYQKRSVSESDPELDKEERIDKEARYFIEYFLNPELDKGCEQEGDPVSENENIIKDDPCPPELFTNLVNNIKREQCTPFIGALAREYLLSEHPRLAETLAKEKDYPFNNLKDLGRITKYIEYKHDPQWSRDRIIELLEDSAVKKSDNTHGEPFHTLAQLPIPLYITSNYDNLMYNHLIKEKPKTRRVVPNWRKALDIYKYGNPELRDNVTSTTEHSIEPTVSEPIVFHLNGHIGDYGSMIVTEDDQLDFLMAMTMEKILGRNKSHIVIPSYVERAINNNSLLLIGYRLYDWSFRIITRLIKLIEMNSTLQHLASQQPIMQLSEKEDAKRRRGEKYISAYLERNGFKPCWDDIGVFTKKLDKYYWNKP